MGRVQRHRTFPVEPLGKDSFDMDSLLWKKAAAGLLAAGLTLGATACENDGPGTVEVTETEDVTERKTATETATETRGPTETEPETKKREVATETGRVTETKTEFRRP